MEPVITAQSIPAVPATSLSAALLSVIGKHHPSNFTTAGAVVRSDFYQIPPSDSGGAVKYLGYFELSTNGVMTYVAYPLPER